MRAPDSPRERAARREAQRGLSWFLSPLTGCLVSLALFWLFISFVLPFFFWSLRYLITL